MNRKSRIIIISIFAAVGLLVFVFNRGFFGAKPVEKENNIAFVLPEEIVLAGELIPLTWTDDNTGENLIIKSDRQYYDGRDSSEVFFSITNISAQDQKPDIKFLFDEKEGRGTKEIALLNSQNDIIASGQTNYYKAVIYYPQNSNGEFFIEAKGDKGGYGFLDPYYASGLVGNWTFNGSDITREPDVLDESFTGSTFPPTATCNSGWTTGGNANWARDTGTYDTSPAAAASGAILDLESTWIDCNVTLGATSTLSFSWKVSSEDTYDFLQFCYDNDACTLGSGYDQRISGEVGFTTATKEMAAGTHSLRWLYAKDQNTIGGSDKGWIDTLKIVKINNSTAVDRSGQGNNGTLTNGPTPAPGISGQALSFDGTDDYVDMGNNSSLQLTGAMTISAWVYIDQFGVTGTAVNSRFVSKQGGSGNRGWNLTVEDSDDKVAFNISSDGTIGFSVSATNVAQTGVWTHYAGVFEPSTAVRIYVNGVLNNSNTTSIPASQFNSSVTALIGARNDCSNCYLDGLIDEARVYNRALSASEVQDLYKIGTARLKVNTPITLRGSQSGLVGNWTFNGPDTTWTSATAGTTADKSGNNNTGTMTNMSRDTSPAPGISGQALSFDGSNDYVEIPYSANLNNITTGITFSAWLKPSSGSLSSRRDIIQRWYDGNVWWFKLDNLGKLSFYAPNITGGVYKESTNAISEGVWTYGVITYDDATDIRFYINGQLDNTITASGSFLTSTSGIWIGINGYDLSTPFNGLIDELRIYNRALSASEVQDLYRIGAARLKVNTPITQRGSQSGLVGNWTFNGPDMGSISQLGSELVTNGNFGSNITGWQNDGSASTIAWQNAASGDGSTGYLRFTIASNADYDRFDSTSSVASANTTYRVSYWYRTSGITGNLNTFFTDDFFNLTNTVWANELTPSTSWQFVSFDLTTNSLSYPYFGIAKAGSIGSGTFDVDAISVKEITTTTIALDRSGSGNNGTTTNMSTASLAPGISGQALKFDGVDDRVDTTNFMSSGVTAFTLQAWVYKTATKDARIVYKNNAGNTGHPVFGLASGGTDQIRCRLRISDSSGTDFSASTISLNTWTFVACTYDGSNVRVYKNGAEVDFVAETGTLAATNDVVVIGQNETGTSVDRHWPGLIDEVRVYNRALSASEILDLYRVGARRVKIRQ